MEQMAKRVLKTRWREGVSAYYIYLYDRQMVPANFHTNYYYFLVNLSKPQSEINYTPVVLRTSYDAETEGPNLREYNSYKEHIADPDNLEAKLVLAIDLDDEVLIDFLLNNQNNERWIKLYQIFYEKKIELDLFEEIIFDYIFKQGLSIRQIAKLTNNSASWIYRYRKSLLDKIRIVLNEGSKK